MHVPHLDALDARRAAPAFLSPPGYTGHAHFRERALSRRRFVQTAAGAAMVVGAGLWLPATAAAAPPGTGAPKPIPGGTDLQALLGLGPGPTYHFYFPAFGEEVSTVGDLNGFVAAAEIRGTGTATDTASGATSTLTYDADVRFMDGVYVGQDGRTRRGTFGFIWLDLFTGQFAQQIHDFNPGILPSPPGGLFWTQPIPRGSVAIDLDAASAAMRLSNWAIPDYTDIFNSAGLTDPPLATIPSTVSFDARWRGKPGATLTSIRDASRSFVGEFIDSLATIAWTAQQPSTHFAFTSAPAASSTTVSGVIGRERNGRFFS